MKAIVIGGSKGIGKSISNALKIENIEVIETSRKDINTSDLKSVKKFIKKNSITDILILNTGGPPPKSFKEISEADWNKYHTQLFLGFCVILKNIKINQGGYIFLISSAVIKEPSSNLIISSAYRSAFNSVFKILSKEYAKENISCINIAPGLIQTNRTKELIKNIDKFKKTLPMKRLGQPDEIGNFVKSIIKNEIKYLSGVTINFDGANSNYIF